jgi:hypothetical protein
MCIIATIVLAGTPTTAVDLRMGGRKDTTMAKRLSNKNNVGKSETVVGDPLDFMCIITTVLLAGTPTTAVKVADK